MHKLLLSLVLSTVSIVVQAQSATPLVVRPPLTAVTMYLNRAELEHQTKVSLPAGTSTLLLQDLSPKANNESMEIRLGDGAELVSLGDADALPARLISRPATDSLAQANEEIARVEAEVKGLEEEKSFWLANRTLPAGTQAGWSAEMQKGATALRTRLVAIQLETNKLQSRLVTLRAQVATLAPRTGAASAEAAPMVLVVRAIRAITVPLTVRYYTNNSSRSSFWIPKLDIRANDSAHELQFALNGQIRNQSGVAWQRVRLTLVNQTLDADVSRPELNPWALDFDGGDHIGEGRIDQFVVKGTAKGQTAEVAQSTTYELPEPVTLAVGARRTMKLSALTLPARPEYLALPKLTQDVFLQAKVTGWEGLQLPESATVYHRGAYVGDTELNTRAYNDSLEIALGHDEQLVVGRTKLEDFSGKAGLSSNRRVRLTYELNVRNRHAEAVRVRVVDQVPVSSEKSIEVKVLETSGAQLDERTGKLTWILNLPAGASKRLRFSFQVDYPQDKEVEIIQHRQTIKSPKFR